MYGKPIAAPELPSKPLQFTLRSILLLMLGCAILCAIVFQWGVIGCAVCWLAFCVGAMCYGAYWARWGWLSVGLIIFLIGAWVYAMPKGYVPSRRGMCSLYLKQIGLAVHHYHDVYGSFPPAYIADENGRPMHSWRVLILPYLEEKELYDQYRFDEPWDGPNNRRLACRMPRIYRCPSDESAPAGTTSYLAVVGPETMWPDTKVLDMADIKDGGSNTVAIVESHDSGIHWMEPRDLHTLQMPIAVNPKHGQGICSCHRQCAQFVRVDGSVGQFDSETPPAEVRAALTRAAGD